METTAMFSEFSFYSPLMAATEQSLIVDLFKWSLEEDVFGCFPEALKQSERNSLGQKWNSAVGFHLYANMHIFGLIAARE